MISHLALRPSLRLLLAALITGLFPSSVRPPLTSALTPAAPFGPFVRSTVLAQPQTAPMSSVPQPDVTPGSRTAHAGLPPIQRPIGQRLPLTFAPTSGQVDSRVLFQAHGMGAQLFFTHSYPKPERQAHP